MRKLLITLGALAVFQLQAGNCGEKERKCPPQAPATGAADIRTIRTPCPIDSRDITDGKDLETDWTLYVPNTFTPNNDGLNDRFEIYGTGILKAEIEIYNRSGEKLFESKESCNGWDGNYKGQPCEVATYVYFLQVYTSDGSVKRKLGHVNLIR